VAGENSLYILLCVIFKSAITCFKLSGESKKTFRDLTDTSLVRTDFDAVSLSLKRYKILS
jgi:hypothetical protein